MSNDDKRRRQDGSTAKLSVADLLARREAETQPIPRITADGARNRTTERINDDEETVRFSVASLAAGAASTTNLSGRELHITELLRREGRAGEEERGGGGFSVPKLVAMASGGVVLAGAVTFTATNLLSSPDELPPAEVRFDARAAARATNTLTKDLGAAAAQQQAPQQQTTTETTTTTPERTTDQRTQRPATQPTTTTTQQQAPSTQEPAPSSNPETTTPAPSTTTTTPAPSTTTPPASSSTPPPSSSTPPAEDGDSGTGVGLELDLGGILDPIVGGFDFFAPAN
ncbi:hypothetical protein ALI22I_36255 [Saccharothrix sp. ALI-22-I]|uniref:hypothetical protein n=1 Tax=Saccharothrix sp. ALI-22-I TaxID=1933778 RepID=UPI00097C8B3F|nr:hypothetical protein [Saccharothrix sp. ALI-22-I]ONI83883.1 hypothetical protein ALI22I_36255 [Saccharothrix sp. ALI-22-I]